MQDTFKWTRETINEFLDSFPDADLVQLAERMEQFKSSKSPKKEWEIVAYSFEPLKGIDKPVLVTQGSKYWERAISGDKDFLIHSVRRLSDGEVFSVGDRINGGIIQKIDTTTSSMDGIMFRTANVSKPISCAEKLPQPILTTVDGVEIRENEECWIVDKNYNLLPEPEKINEFKRNYYSNCFIFSTRQAAEEYILNNRPLLSLNDVKEKLSEWVAPGLVKFVIGSLTALVKQKLNQ